VILEQSLLSSPRKEILAWLLTPRQLQSTTAWMAVDDGVDGCQRGRGCRQCRQFVQHRGLHRRWRRWGSAAVQASATATVVAEAMAVAEEAGTWPGSSSVTGGGVAAAAVAPLTVSGDRDDRPYLQVDCNLHSNPHLRSSTNLQSAPSNEEVAAWTIETAATRTVMMPPSGTGRSRGYFGGG
jgi:hypothetical protein